MEFVYPQFFWVMMVPFVIFALLVITNRDKVSRIFSDEVLKRLRANTQTLPDYIRNIVLFSAIFMMLVALARPVIAKGERDIELKGITALVAIDISGSMRSRDVYPNRLEFAKIKAKELLDSMVNDEVALGTFAYTSFIVSPFTSDKATLKQLVDGLNANYISNSSTDFISVVNLANKMLTKKKEKALIIFTDGGDKDSLKGLKERLKKYGITLYTVLVGTKQGAPVLNERGEKVKNRDGTIAITQRYDKLIEIAKESGGYGLVAKYGKEDMESLASEIHSNFNDINRHKIKIKERIELFYYPLTLAVILLLIGFISLPTDKDWYKFWKKREKRSRKFR